MHGWHSGSSADLFSSQVLDAQVKLLTDYCWHIVDRKEADTALGAEGPVSWSRETLSEVVTDSSASAVICIVLFII